MFSLAAHARKKACTNVSGLYSINNMVCQGSADKPYLALNNRMFKGDFSQYDLIEIVQKDCEGMTVRLISNRDPKTNQEVNLPEFKERKKLKMNFLEDIVRVHQGNFFNHFVASFEKAGNDLVIMNEHATGLKTIEIIQECQLPNLR